MIRMFPFHLTDSTQVIVRTGEALVTISHHNTSPCNPPRIIPPDSECRKIFHSTRQNNYICPTLDHTLPHSGSYSRTCSPCHACPPGRGWCSWCPATPGRRCTTRCWRRSKHHSHKNTR